MFKFLLTALVGIMAIAAISVGTFAAFSDTETSTGNEIAAGSLDLVVDIDGVDTEPVGTIAALDQTAVPGQEDEVTLSFKNTGSINGDLTVTLTKGATDDSENGCNEPETTAGDANCGTPGVGEGELDDQTYLAIWRETDCDNLLDGTEVATYSGSWAGMGSPLTVINAEQLDAASAETECIGVAWSFVDDAVDATSAGFPGGASLALAVGDNNLAQGDTVALDLDADLDQQ
ncbi:MAG: TasA family protein [Dehalococcoidia bacterium]